MMLFQPLRASALALAVILPLTACNERQQTEPSTATPEASAPSATIERYPGTLAEGVDFSKPGYPIFLAAVNGLSGHEPWGRWSDGEIVTLQFAQPLPTQFTLILTAQAFGPNIGLPVIVKAGASEQTFTLPTAEQHTHRLNFTLAAPADSLEFRIPQPVSPAELKVSEDPRKLGIGFIKLQITP